MSVHTRHPFPDRAERPLSRRASFFGIGSAALTAAALPASIRAGKAGKKAKKKCKKQIGQCQASVTALCANPQLTFPQEDCEAEILPCCQSFKGCKAGAAYDCIVDALVALVPPE